MNANLKYSSSFTAVPSRLERIHGCLLAGAVGDALGAPVEFLKRAQILEEFGPQGVRCFSQAFGRIGAITDDTQMSLFTAEAMIRASLTDALPGDHIVVDELTAAYLRWLRTQTERPPAPVPDAARDGWLLSHPGIYARRVPGITCIDALESLRNTGDRQRNDSKGCGTVMRAAPIGIVCAALPAGRALALRWGAESGAITHGHPTGQLAAAALAMLIAELVNGQPLAAALESVRIALAEHSEAEELRAALEHAMHLAASAPNSSDALRKLGGGWIAEEALAIALYCALSAPDLPSALFLSVNHDGDSDSTGSITGNLVGCLYGQASIPEALLQHLELRSVIEQVAEDLGRLTDWLRAGRTAGAHLDTLCARYGRPPPQNEVLAGSDLAVEIAMHIASSVERATNTDMGEH
jgi:ADP-ribosylglycohydrolase